MLSDHTPLQRFGYTLMGCVVAFAIAFVIARGLRRPATIELHQTAQPPVLIHPDPPYGSKRSDFTTPYTPIEAPATGQDAAAGSLAQQSDPTPAATGKPARKSSHGGKQPTQVVNINTASEQDFQTLPGIGPTLAKRIVDYRQSHQPFVSVDDLEAIQGLGRKRLDKIRQWLTVGQ